MLRKVGQFTSLLCASISSLKDATYYIWGRDWLLLWLCAVNSTRGTMLQPGPLDATTNANFKQQWQQAEGVWDPRKTWEKTGRNAGFILCCKRGWCSSPGRSDKEKQGDRGAGQVRTVSTQTLCWSKMPPELLLHFCTPTAPPSPSPRATLEQLHAEECNNLEPRKGCTGAWGTLWKPDGKSGVSSSGEHFCRRCSF